MLNQFPLRRPESQYMIVSNEMIDVIMRSVSSSAFKVLFAIYRNTEGWNKESDAISLSQLSTLTGIATNEAIVAAVRELETKGLIKAVRGAKVTTQYSIDQDYKLPDLGGKSDKAESRRKIRQDSRRKIRQDSPKLGGKSATQKTGEDISKDRKASSSQKPNPETPQEAEQAKAPDALGDQQAKLSVPPEAQPLWGVISPKKRGELANRLSKYPQAYAVLLEQYRAAVEAAAGKPNLLAGIYINKITDALAYLEMPPVVIDLSAPVEITLI